MHAKINETCFPTRMPRKYCATLKENNAAFKVSFDVFHSITVLSSGQLNGITDE